MSGGAEGAGNCQVGLPTADEAMQPGDALRVSTSVNIRGVAIAVALVVAAVAAIVAFNWPRPEWWDRKHPLASPVAVVGVEGGRLTLADGRVFEPAGIVRPDDVDPDEYDEFLRTVAAQGVEVVRDLGDGRAFLRAEPKFWNWCGTCRRQRGNWAGSFFTVALSEYACSTGYAVAQPDQPGISSHERWRLESVDELARGYTGRPRFHDGQIEYDSNARHFHDWDELAPAFGGPRPE